MPVPALLSDCGDGGPAPAQPQAPCPAVPGVLRACSPRPVAPGLPRGSGGGNKVFPQRGPRSLPAPHAQVAPGARSAEPPGQSRTVPQADAAADLRVWALGEAVSRKGCRRPPLLLMSERPPQSPPPPLHGWLTGPWLLPRAPFMARRSPRSRAAPGHQPLASLLPCPCSPGLRITPEPECAKLALTAEGAGQAGPAPGLDSLATGSSVTGQSRGPGCLSPLQPVQQRQGESYERLCQSCRLPGSSRSSTDICSAPPPPSPFQASCLSWAEGQGFHGKAGITGMGKWARGHRYRHRHAGWVGVTRGRRPGPDCR